MRRIILGEKTLKQLQEEEDQLKENLDVTEEIKNELIAIAAGNEKISEKKDEAAKLAEREAEASEKRLQQLRDELELLQSKDKVLTKIQQDSSILEADKEEALRLADLIEKEKKRQKDELEHKKAIESQDKKILADRERAERELERIREKAEEDELARRDRVNADPGGLQATEGRLLTRGSQNKGLDEQKRTTKAAEKTAQKVEELIALVEKQTSEEAQGVEFEEVG